MQLRRNRLYDEFAHLYPLISGPVAYAKEAAFWKMLIRERLGPGRHKLLEQGVGGGFFMSHFTSEFEMVGTDLSEKMCRNSEILNPGVRHYAGDMRTMQLGEKFKGVLISDAICYMQSESDLRQTFENAYQHLEPGGLFITCPDYVKETFTDGMFRHNTLADDKTMLTHLEFEFDPEPIDTVNELLLFYLIRQKGKLRIEQDIHTFGLFPRQTWVELLTESGFATEAIEFTEIEDRPLTYIFVGTKK